MGDADAAVVCIVLGFGASCPRQPCTLADVLCSLLRLAGVLDVAGPVSDYRWRQTYPRTCELLRSLFGEMLGPAFCPFSFGVSI